MKRARVVALVVTIVTSFAQLAQAQDRSDREWHNSVSIYGFGASVTGETRLTGQAIDVGLSDILDNLQMIFMGAYRGNNERFSLMADLIFIGLGNSRDTGLVRSADLDELIVDVTAGYRFSPIIEAFAGLRITNLSTKIGLVDPLRRELEGSETFYDPIFGVRVIVPLDQDGKWWFQSRGDIGGFGVGMDLTWQAMANFGYKPSELISIWGGYRALGQDFDGAGELGKLGMTVTYHGPLFGLGFHF